MKPDQVHALAVALYGVVSGTLGIYGYVKSKSLASVLAGEAGFFLSAFAAGLMWTARAGDRTGVHLALGVSALLALVFALLFARSKRFMPAGALFAASLAVAVSLAARLL